MNKCWKFQSNRLIHKKVIAIWLKIISYKWPQFAGNGPNPANCGHLLQKIFSLLTITFFMNQAIALKFSAFVHHMSALNWQKIFWYYSICGSVVPPIVPKPRTPLVTIFVEIFFQKIFWWGSRPTSATPWKESWISWKKWRFEIFPISHPSR